MAELDTEDFRLIAHERAGEVIKLRAEVERLRTALEPYTHCRHGAISCGCTIEARTALSPKATTPEA